MKTKQIAIFLAAAFLSAMLPAVALASDETVATATFGTLMAKTTNMFAELSYSDPVLETQDNVVGWRLDADDLPKANIRCDIADKVMKNLAPGTSIAIDVTYYDDSYGGFALIYDALGGEKKSQFVQMTATYTWKTHTFVLYDARFSNGIYTYDFQILTNDSDCATDEQGVMDISPYDVLISALTVKRLSTVSPYKITANTQHPGNIFFENDSIEFDIDFEDLTAAHPTASIAYTVKNCDGDEIYTANSSIVNAKSHLALPTLDFGVYTLDIDLSGNNVAQKQTIDFSYSKKAEQVNFRFGTNIHYNWHVYNDEDIRNMADLAKAAGYGFARTTVQWDQTEQSKGVYAMPHNTLYSNQYMNQIGLEQVNILSNGNMLYDYYPYWLDDNAEQLAAYANFCGYVVGQLKPYSNYFTSPNEFNLTHGGVHHAENYQQYCAIVKAAYPLMKQANPDVFITSGAVGRYEAEYIENCYKENILDYCDAFSMHVYDYIGGPETWYIYPTMQQHTDLLKSYDSTKKAWITENGWPTRNVSFASSMAIPVATEQQQAKWYSRSLAINSDPDRIDKYFHYSFVNNNLGYFDQENNFGILNARDYRTPFAAKPAYIATAAFSSIVGTRPFVGDMDDSDQLFAYKFSSGDGDEVMQLWSYDYNRLTETDRSYTYVSDKPYFQISDLYGNTKTVENKTGSYTVSYTPEPVFIKAVDAPKTAEITVENVSSIWLAADAQNVNISISAPNGTNDGDSVTVVCAGYDNGGKLVYTDIKEKTVADRTVAAEFAALNMLPCDAVKFFAVDSMNTMRPLAKTKVFPYFGNDESVVLTKNGSSITVSGTLAGKKPLDNVIITVLNEDIKAQQLSAETFGGYMLYQNQQKSDENGGYSFTFSLPEEFLKNAAIQISSPDGATQKMFYAN